MASATALNCACEFWCVDYLSRCGSCEHSPAVPSGGQPYLPRCPHLLLLACHSRFIALAIRSGTFRITRRLIWCTEVGKGPAIRCWEQCSLFLGTLWTGEAVAIIMRHQQRQPVGFTKETCLDETCGRGGREWEGESRLGWNLGWKWIIMMQLIKVYHSQGPFVKWLLLPSLFLEPCDLSLCSDPFSHESGCPIQSCFEPTARFFLSWSLPHCIPRKYFSLLRIFVGFRDSGGMSLGESGFPSSPVHPDCPTSSISHSFHSVPPQSQSGQHLKIHVVFIYMHCLYS